MSTIDVELLLQSATTDGPCGKNLQYEAAFQQMEQAATQREASQFEPDKAPDPPDWRVVRDRALELLPVTKDLRVAVFLVRAARASGFEDLDRALKVLVGLVRDYWADVHPQLEPDYGDDPTRRINVLGSLRDSASMLDGVRRMTLVSDRQAGTFCYRDWQLATGETSRQPGDPDHDESVILAAFQGMPLASLQSLQETATRLVGRVEELDAALTEMAGAKHAISFESLRDTFADIADFLAARRAERGDATTTEGDPADREPSEERGIRTSGTIRSREDVIRLLDKICDWYQRSEPSSPVPLLLQRAKRLVSKGFVEILKDLAPEGVKEAQKVTGVDT